MKLLLITKNHSWGGQRSRGRKRYSLIHLMRTSTVRRRVFWLEGGVVLWVGWKEKEQRLRVTPAVSLSGLQPLASTKQGNSHVNGRLGHLLPKRRTCSSLICRVPLTPFPAAKVWRSGEGYSGCHRLCSSRASEQDSPQKPY